MDFTVRWSPEATEDLESIAEYIARDSDYYAQAVVSNLLDTSRTIKEQPLIGRMVPEVSKNEVRECFVYSYRLVYKIQKTTIIIIAIIHGKRLFDNIQDRF
ncbi:MAG: type II toxin-antitoxin system RelE/ParE family toxin [Spirochaetales bacterium]|nr:type II toxin-antitoxin system RelE/ParE family toxin [Spirochaetales bacterium]